MSSPFGPLNFNTSQAALNLPRTQSRSYNAERASPSQLLNFNTSLDGQRTQSRNDQSPLNVHRAASPHFPIVQFSSFAPLAVQVRPMQRDSSSSSSTSVGSSTSARPIDSSANSSSQSALRILSSSSSSFQPRPSLSQGVNSSSSLPQSRSNLNQSMNSSDSSRVRTPASASSSSFQSRSSSSQSVSPSSNLSQSRPNLNQSMNSADSPRTRTPVSASSSSSQSRPSSRQSVNSSNSPVNPRGQASRRMSLDGSIPKSTGKIPLLGDITNRQSPVLLKEEWVEKLFNDCSIDMCRAFCEQAGLNMERDFEALQVSMQFHATNRAGLATFLLNLVREK